MAYYTSKSLVQWQFHFIMFLDLFFTEFSILNSSVLLYTKLHTFHGAACENVIPGEQMHLFYTIN